jgi:putative phage-type endonuclease
MSDPSEDEPELSDVDATTARIGTAELVGTFEVGSPEWHAARANGLGGSEIAAVLGLSKWESPLSLWLRKAQQIPLDDEDKSEMEAGRRLEEAICQKFADTHPEYLMSDAGTYRHTDRPWEIANPDKFLAHRENGYSDGVPTALLEAKFAIYDEEWGDPGTDQIPPYYLTQTRWYLDVFGLDTCYVEVFIGSQGEFREYIVKADPMDQAFLVDAAAGFMQSLAAGERPPVDGHDETYRAIRKLHAGIERDLDIELSTATFTEYVEAKRLEKAFKAANNKASSLVLEEMGDARRALYAQEVIAHRLPGKASKPPFLKVANFLHTKFPESTDAQDMKEAS